MKCDATGMCDDDTVEGITPVVSPTIRVGMFVLLTTCDVCVSGEAVLVATCTGGEAILGSFVLGIVGFEI